MEPFFFYMSHSEKCGFGGLHTYSSAVSRGTVNKSVVL